MGQDDTILHQDDVEAVIADVVDTAVQKGTSITGVVAAGPLKDLLTALAAEGLIVDNTTLT